LQSQQPAAVPSGALQSASVTTSSTGSNINNYFILRCTK
jgi:hypothetical protein